MSGQEPSGKPEKVEVGGELILPVAALIFTFYYFSTIIESPWTAQVNAFLVGSILIAVVLIFVIKCARMLLAGKATLGMSNLWAPRAILWKRIGFIVLTLTYLVAINWFGFTLTTFLFLWGSMLLLCGGKRTVYHAVIAAIMALVGWAAFIALFETRLPKGAIEKLLAGFM